MKQSDNSTNLASFDVIMEAYINISRYPLILDGCEAYWIKGGQVKMNFERFLMLTPDIQVRNLSLNLPFEASEKHELLPSRFGGRSHTVWSYRRCC